MIILLLSCSSSTTEIVTTDVAVAPTVVVASTADCTQAKNTCPDYAPSWSGVCPAGSRCLQFTNASPTETVALSYQIGCNGDGTKGAPQCDCTNGPVILPGGSAYFAIVDGDYTSCLPSWTPSCLTAGLAVVANATTASCAAGTRVEFTAGNNGDPYSKFDSYNLSRIEGYSLPVVFSPELACAKDSANHDCRPLVCASAACEDAYSTPTSGTCPDGRSPQGNCQDTFSGRTGFSVIYYPNSVPVSCQDAVPCSVQ